MVIRNISCFTCEPVVVMLLLSGDYSLGLLLKDSWLGGMSGSIGQVPSRCSDSVICINKIPDNN